jgi:pilus assembly protein CpaE
MARLTASILSNDEAFRAQVSNVLRASGVSVASAEDRSGSAGATGPDVVIVDGRENVPFAVETVERIRVTDPGVGIFFVANESNPDLILRAMRAGANEFFAWPLAREAFDDAVSRTSARRASAPGAKPLATTIVFFGSKGGAGTTTMAVNCGVEIARQSKRPAVIVDLKPGLGEVSLFLGVRSRYTLIDALDNLHRLDQEFMKELVARHKSGLDILAGSDLFDRPGTSDSGMLEEVFRLLGRQYEYIVIDAGAHMNSCSVAALYTADTICLVTNPDVACVRNAQRLLDRIGQLGASGDRVRVLLNRASEPCPIPPAQIQNALGHPIHHTFPSDYRTVSSALNTGVPLTMMENTDMAAQFDLFTKRMLDPTTEVQPRGRRSTLGLERIASLW